MVLRMSWHKIVLGEIVRVALVVAGGVVGLGLVGCGGGGDGGGEGPRFAYVTNGVDPFWTIAEAGAMAAGEELGVEVRVMMPAGGAVDQKNILEDLVTRGVDGIAVSPVDPANQVEFLSSLAERTLLITHDSDAPEANREVFVGVDNYEAGRLCGQLVKEALPDGGSVMIFVGRMEQDNARRRRQGLIDELLGRDPDPSRFDPPGEVIEGGGYVVLGTLTDQFDRLRAKANVEDTLTRTPDIGAMVGLFAYNTPMILEALAPAGKAGEVVVVGFDEADATLQGLLDGTVYGTVVQDPYMYGYRSVEVLKALHEGDRSVVPEGGMLEVPARAIRKEGAQEFWDDLKIKRGE